MKENQETPKENKGSIDSVRRALDEFSNANPDGLIFSFVSAQPQPCDNSGLFVSGQPKDIAIMLAFVLNKEPKIDNLVRTAVGICDKYEELKSKQKGKQKQKENENTKNQSLN